MQLTQFLLVAGAIGASAHPSAHGHLHRAVHAKREGPVFLKPVRPHVPAPKPTEAVVEPTPTPVASVPEPKPKPSAPSTDAGSDSYIPFCSDTGSKKAKRVTLEQILYTGNLGMDNGCPWNSNLMLVPASIHQKYKYVQEYHNVANEPYQVMCSNKMGADRKNTGSFKIAGQNPLIFTLQPGEKAYVAAQHNTQGICAFAPNEIPFTKHGQYAGVWAEFDFENTSNNGWSGADCSSLVAQAYGMDVPGCRMSEGGVNSDILPGGFGTNAYTIGMEALDGIGLNIVPGQTLIEVKVGFSG
ncbi:hypothetical protein QBC38DRAFT_355418 [Podospora fimiseda]|uniref:Allergen Asp f 4 n=1 Tax=Podospora fimiseda TaxID=252190 RepID=A0AAN7H3H3_9PEZI|nr:hypothetical protein QBC38DRAFT_355418 [Podospora fimiseda]